MDESSEEELRTSQVEKLVIEAFSGLQDKTSTEEEDGQSNEETVAVSEENSPLKKFSHPKYLGVQVVKKGSILRSLHGSFFLFSHILPGPKFSTRIYVCSNRKKFTCPVEIEERVSDGFCLSRNNHSCPLKPIAIEYVDPLGTLHPLDHPFRIDYRQRSDLPILKSTKDVRVLIGPDRDSTEILRVRYFLTWNMFHYYCLSVLPHKCSTMTGIQYQPPKVYPVEISIHDQFKDEVILPIPIPRTRIFEQSGLRDVWESSYITIFEIFPSRGPCSGRRVVEIYFSMSSPTGMNFVPFCYLPSTSVEGFKVSSFLEIHSVRPMDPAKRSSLGEQNIWPSVRGKPTYVMVCTSYPHPEGYVDLEISTVPQLGGGKNTKPSLSGKIRNAYFFHNEVSNRIKEPSVSREGFHSSSSSSDDDDDESEDLEEEEGEDDDDDEELVVKKKKSLVIPLRRYSHRFQYVTSSNGEDGHSIFNRATAISYDADGEKLFRRNLMGMTPIHVHACNGDLKKLKSVYESIMNLTPSHPLNPLLQVDYFQNTPLHYAYLYDRLEIVRFILSVEDEVEGRPRAVAAKRWEARVNYRNWTPVEFTRWERRVRNIYSMLKLGIFDMIMKYMSKRDIVHLTISSKSFYLYYHHNEREEPSHANKIPSLVGPNIPDTPLGENVWDGLRRESIRWPSEFVAGLYPTHRGFHSSFECCQSIVRVVFVGQLTRFQWNEDESRLYLLSMKYSDETQDFEISCSRLVLLDEEKRTSGGKIKNRPPSTAVMFHNRPVSTYETPKIVWQVKVSCDTEFHWQREKKTIRILYDHQKMVAEFFFFNYVELRRFVGHIKVIVSMLKKYTTSTSPRLPVEKMCMNVMFHKGQVVGQRNVEAETWRKIESLKNKFPLTYLQKLKLTEEGDGKPQKLSKTDGEEKIVEFVILQPMSLLDPTLCDSEKFSMEYLKCIMLPDNLETKDVFGDPVEKIISLYDLINKKKKKFSLAKIQDYFKKRKYIMISQPNINRGRRRRSVIFRSKTLKDLKEDLKKKYYDNEFQIHHPFKEVMYRPEYCERILDDLRILQYQDYEVDFPQKKRYCKILRKLVYLEKSKSKSKSYKNNNKRFCFDEIENFLLVGKPYLWNKRECFFRLLFLLLFSYEDIYNINKLISKDDDEEEETQENKYMVGNNTGSIELTPEYFFDTIIVNELKKRMRTKYGDFLEWSSICEKEMNYRKFETVLHEMNETWMKKYYEHHVYTMKSHNNSNNNNKRRRRRRNKKKESTEEEEDYMIRFEYLSFEVFRQLKIRDLRNKILNVTERIKQIRFIGLKKNTSTTSTTSTTTTTSSSFESVIIDDGIEIEEIIEEEEEQKQQQRRRNKKNGNIFSIFSPSDDFEEYHRQTIPKDFFDDDESGKSQMISEEEEEEQQEQEQVKIFSEHINIPEEQQQEMNPLDRKLRNYKSSTTTTTKKKKLLDLDHKAENLGLKYVKKLKKKLQHLVEREERATRLLRLKFMMSKSRVQEMERFLRLKFEWFLGDCVGIGLDSKICYYLWCSTMKARNSTLSNWKKKRQGQEHDDDDDENSEEESDSEEEKEEEDIDVDRRMRFVVTMMNRVGLSWREDGLVTIGPAEELPSQSSSQAIPISLLECQSPILCGWEELVKKLNQIVIRIMEWNAHFLFQPVWEGKSGLTFRASLSSFGIGPKSRNSKSSTKTPNKTKSTKHKTELDFCEDILRIMNFSGFYQNVYSYLQKSSLIAAQLSRKNKWTQNSTDQLVFLDVERRLYESVPEAFETLGYDKYVPRVEFARHSDLDQFVLSCIRKMPQFETIYPGTFSLLKSFDRSFWMKYFMFCCSPTAVSIRKSQLLLSSPKNNNMYPFHVDLGYYEAKYGRYRRGCPFNVRFRSQGDFSVVSRKLRIPNRPPKLGRVRNVSYPKGRRKTRKILRYTSFF